MVVALEDEKRMAKQMEDMELKLNMQPTTTATGAAVPKDNDSDGLCTSDILNCLGNIDSEEEEKKVDSRKSSKKNKRQSTM